ncbi:MAG: hypothetical protein DBY41_07135 [Clostridium sp.]|nr:MAG: hypothetical protein DBY41_07135 [Clostridium sp.]
MIVFMREYRKNLLKFFSIFGVFFFCVLLNTNKVEAVGQDIGANGHGVQTAYDINEVYVSGGKIHIKGWYIAKRYQNYAATPSSHNYYLTISGIDKQYWDKNDYSSGDITNLEYSAGKSWCNSNIWGQPGVNLTCNYYYNDVGFHFEVPLSDFNDAIRRGVKDFFFTVNLECYSSSAGKATFSQQVYVTKNRVGDNGITFDFGNGYRGNLSSNLEIKIIRVQAFNAYVKNWASKNASKPKSGKSYIYWGEGYTYNNRGYAGNVDNSDWYSIWYGGVEWQRRSDGRSRLAAVNGGGSTGYIPTVYFTLGDAYNNDNLALHISILNSYPTITASTQTYYTGQELTKDMILSNIEASDNEDGKWVQNGDNNKISVSLSSNQVKFSGNKVITDNLIGDYKFTATVTDGLGAKTSVDFTVKFIQNTAPEFDGITQDDYRILYIRSYNLKTKDILENIKAYDKHDGDLTNNIILKKDGTVYDDEIDRNIPAIYKGFSVEVKDIPLFDVASHEVRKTNDYMETNSFSVSGGRNYQISVPSTKYRILEYNSNGTQIKDTGWMNKSTGNYANSYTTRSNATQIRILMNASSIKDPTSIHCIRDVWAQNVSLTTKLDFTQEVRDYFPPELSSHEFYYFVGYDVNQEEILKDVEITDSRFDVNDIRKTLKFTNWEDLNKDVAGDYYLQVTATNAGIEENPDLAEEKYTGYLTITVHMISKDDNQFKKGNIRYINNKYFTTLKSDSNWFKNEVLTNRLRKTLEKTTGKQDNEDILMSFQFTGKDIKNLKTYINQHGASNIFQSDFNKLFFNKLLSFSHDGKLEDGWIKIDGYWCYQHFDKKNVSTLYTSCWKDIDGARYYFDENGHIAQNKWQTIDDVLYYFTNDGSLAHGWTLINGKWYYFDDNYQRVIGFYKINNDTYYFDASGVKMIGWQSIDGVQYYFGETGIMVYGGIYTIDGVTYIFMDDGSVPYNIVHYKDKIYFVDSITGIVKNDIRKYEGYSYFLGSDGCALKGWQEFKGKRYFIDDDYHVCLNMFGTINGKTYYFDEAGSLYTKEGLITVNEKLYYIQNDWSVLKTSWKTIDGFKYYFGTNGSAETGISTIDNDIYYFNNNGQAQQNLWFDDYYFGVDGKAVNGWQTLQYTDSEGNTSAKEYYFENHKVVKNRIIEYQNKKYYFNNDGHLTTGFIPYEEEFYYFDTETKAMVTDKSLNFQTDYYYFGADGKAIKDTWKTIDGQKYYYTSDSRRARGITLNIDGNFYYFNDDGVFMKNDILGNWYYNNDGIGEQLIKTYLITGVNSDDDTNLDGDGNPIEDNDTGKKVQVGIFEDGRMIVVGSGNTTTFNASELPSDDLTDEEKANYIIPPWLGDTYEDKDGNIIPITDIIQTVEFMNDDITPESLDYWFTGCTKLEEVKNIPTSVKSMYRTFDGDEKLSSIPNLNNLKSLENMDYAFRGCHYLAKTPLLPNSVLSMNYTFEDNVFLSSITNISNSVKYMNGTFMGDVSLVESPDLPDSVIEMSDIYNGCTSLKTTGTIPTNATVLDRAYMNTTNLQGTLYIDDLNATSYTDIFKNSGLNKELLIYSISHNYETVKEMLKTITSTSKIKLGTSIIVKDMTLKIGDKTSIKVYANIKNANYKFTSLTPTIATIDNNGNISALKTGVVSIKVEEDGGKTTNFTVTVTN